MKTRSVKTLVPVVDGTNGTDAVLYFFTSTVEQVVVTDGSPDSTSITIQLYRRIGNQTPQKGGIFDVEVLLRNGNRYHNRASGEWVLRDSDIDFSTIHVVRCGFYNQTILLAQKEISFVNDAVQLYTWHKYADGITASGYPSELYDEPRDTTRYMGVAYNKPTKEESENPEDYEWVALPKGEDGKTFSPKGVAYGHFNTMQELRDYEFLESGKGYLVDAASIDSQLFKATLYGSNWGYRYAEEGDTYIIEDDKRMWVAIGNVWVDHGVLQGPKGDDGDDGKDAETWSMTVSPKTVRWDGLGASASTIVIMTYKTTGENTVLTRPWQIQVTRVYRNGSPQKTSVHVGPVVTVNISSEASVLEKLEISLMTGIDKILCRETVQFVRELNRMVIPEGVWDETISYTCTEVKSPLVLEGEQYYYMVFEGTSTGVRPSTSAAENGIWRLADKYQLIITQALMANFAKLAAAVFHGDFMFSQYGNSGADADYSQFDPQDPLDNGIWTPNILLDFFKGEFAAACGKVRFRQDGSGMLAGGKVSWGRDGNPTFDGRIRAQMMTLGEGEWVENGNRYDMDLVNHPGTYFKATQFAYDDRPSYMPLASSCLGTEITLIGRLTTRSTGFREICVQGTDDFILERGSNGMLLKKMFVYGFCRLVAVEGINDNGWLISSFTGELECYKADGTKVVIKDNYLIS